MRAATAILIALVTLAGRVAAEPARVGSFNIHYISPSQEKMVWEERREAVRRVIGEMNADILAFQEMETFLGGDTHGVNRQLDWVLQHYPEYLAGAFGDPADFPITQPILYRAERFELIDQGWFFYSETPDAIYSRTFNGGYPAFTTWVVLRDRASDERVRVVNNHFDYGSGHNRRRSAELVIERLQPALDAGEALVVLGDFNAPSFWPPMGRFRAAGLSLVEPSGGTHHWGRGWALLPAIDHILISEAVTAAGPVRRFTQSYDGIYPSDHYPIAAELSFSGKP